MDEIECIFTSKPIVVNSSVVSAILLDNKVTSFISSKKRAKKKSKNNLRTKFEINETAETPIVKVDEVNYFKDTIRIDKSEDTDDFADSRGTSNGR
ncbi:hypothetical protein HK096_001579, partial [Nowakowskiella sp. JEL0078]